MAIGAVLMGAGLALDAYGNAKANKAQAAAEERNAQFLRRQAHFNQQSGERQLLLFDRESAILHGDQLSAFAKAGIDTASSARFMALEMGFRQEERIAIKDEFRLDVDLARLRAEDSQRAANSLRDPTNQMMQTFGILSRGASLL
jgi:peptidyl-tRNA hydrolase